MPGSGRHGDESPCPSSWISVPTRHRPASCTTITAWTCSWRSRRSTHRLDLEVPKLSVGPARGVEEHLTGDTLEVRALVLVGPTGTPSRTAPFGGCTSSFGIRILPHLIDEARASLGRARRRPPAGCPDQHRIGSVERERLPHPRRRDAAPGDRKGPVRSPCGRRATAAPARRRPPFRSRSARRSSERSLHRPRTERDDRATPARRRGREGRVLARELDGACQLVEDRQPKEHRGHHDRSYPQPTAALRLLEHRPEQADQVRHVERTAAGLLRRELHRGQTGLDPLGERAKRVVAKPMVVLDASTPRARTSCRGARAAPQAQAA